MKIGEENPLLGRVFKIGIKNETVFGILFVVVAIR